MGKRKREREEEEDRERRREKKRKREKSKYRDRDDREDRDERRERRHKEKKRRKRERRYSSSESDSETEPLRQDQGPALPPHMMAGPDVPPEVEHDQPQAKVHHGPALPPHLLASMEKKEEEPVEAKKPEPKKSGPIGPSLEDKPEELNTENLPQVGPICPGQMTGQVESFANQRILESRTQRLEEIEAQKMKDKSREDWMLSLPSLDRKNPLGDLLKTSAGPKTFSNRQGPVEQDRSWSATPGEASVTTHIDQAKAFKQSVQGVFDQKSSSEKEKKKQSLLEQHQKKEKKKKKEKPKKPEFRFSGHWDRERDISHRSLSDDQLNKMVDASKGWEGKFTK